MTEKKQYDIILITPYYGAKDGFIWKAIEYRFQSPGILSIASYLNSCGFKASIFDCNLEQITESQFAEKFEKRYGNSGFRYLGFSAATQTINSAYRMANSLKQKYKNIPIIFGGAHPTALPKDVLENGFTDIVVIGEGEITTKNILESDNLEAINGIAYKKNGKVIINKENCRITNLDDLPINDYSLVPMELCKPLIGSYEKLPATIMITARGCPGRCTFCSRVVGNQLSVQSPQRIFDEIKTLYYDFKIRQIIFYDDTFISDRKRIEEFCELLINSDIKISWTCSSRVDKVFPDLLSKMKKAGCHQIMYGIESFNEQVLKNINKKTRPSDIYFAISETKKAKIEIRAAIMLGNLGDTIEILEDNIKQLKKTKPDLIQVAITTPLPGSQLFTNGLSNGSIKTFDWDKYEGSDEIIRHETIPFATLQKYYKKTYMKFYLRPYFICKTIFSINSFLKIKLIFSGIISIVPIVFRSSQKKTN
ncbi:MAG: radical SAM protein [Bacteroidales bacterium]|nr:radical SAM protein [Bacteroidales bacterium]